MYKIIGCHIVLLLLGNNSWRLVKRWLYILDCVKLVLS